MSVEGLTETQTLERARAAKSAIYGAPLGPNIDDLEALREIALEYLRDQLLAQQGDRPRPRTVHNLIMKVLDPSEPAAADREAHYRRLKGKFEEGRDRLIAEATAYNHPLQKARWQKVQQIIDLLAELGLARRREHR
jgi:hypothetical protein